MAVNVEEAISEALMNAVGSLAMVLPHPIAYPGVSYSPVNGTAYLHVTVLPNATRRVFIGNGEPNHHQGILQISVMWPAGQGEIAPRRAAGKIANQLGEGTVLVTDFGNIRIDERPSVMPALQDTVWLNVPVRIPYHAFM